MNSRVLGAAALAVAVLLLYGNACRAPQSAAAAPAASPAPVAVELPEAITAACPARATNDEPAPRPSEPTWRVRNPHLTWQRDPATTVSFTWTTDAANTQSYQPRAIVAPASAACGTGERLFAVGRTTAGQGEVLVTRVGGDRIPVPAWTVEVTGLQPETDYVARVGSWTEVAGKRPRLANISELLHFRTGAPKGSRAPFQVVLAGDSRGGSPEIRRQAERLAAIPAVAWFFNGDMTPRGSQDEWNDWFTAMAPILRRRPLMPVQGNHELQSELYYSQFALPVEPGLAAQLTEHAWSLDLGNVHFVGLDSNTGEGIARQVPWLRGNLAKAQADPQIDYTICMMHHAPWSASAHGSHEGIQATWGPLFDQYGVDLVFSGHDHNYERTIALQGGKAAPPGQGVVYVVAGGFFAPGYPNGHEWFTATSTHGDQHNYVVLNVTDQALTLAAYSGDGGRVLDQFTLPRPPR
ncbi:MAG: metallophosphoesterase family protein [Deltaproteobacteria bacterium]|nr:metallophosphoesterase family protein [Deltaproteobacteria bacterium]